MKKRFILIASSIFLTLFLVLGANYLFSLRKVTFNLSDKVEGVTIYKASKQKIKHLNTSSSSLLTEGKYYAVPEGNNISNEAINFTIEESDKTVTINPSYSDVYLRELLTKEQTAISSAIATKYPALIDGFTLTHGTLYGHGEWFGGLLEPKVNDAREQKDAYRIVLHKQGGKWQVIRRPEYVLTSSRYAEVPVAILRKINSIVK